MNETIKNLIERRSCRKYESKQIKDEELNAILKAGEYAPSGMGLQSPKMVVLQNKETIKKLSKLNAKIMGKDIDPFYSAPTVIVVLADKTKMTYIEDGCLVLGNLMNAAHSLGIGSCWIHRAKEEFATEEGKVAIGGLHMLVGQAVKSQAIFNDREISEELINYIYDDLSKDFK